MADADLWLVKKRVEIEEGTWIDPAGGKTTVAPWAERWLDAVSPQLKLKTVTSYRGLIRSRIVPAFGHLELSAVRPIAVGEWVAAMSREGLSPSRIRQAYRVLSQVMRSAVDNGLIPATPCRGVRLPRMPETEPHILTPQEAARMMAAAQKPHDLCIGLLAFAGLRIGEALALRRADVLANGSVLVIDESLAEAGGVLAFGSPKTHQRRELALSPALAARLVEHLAALPPGEDTLLFSRADGGPMRYNQWRKAYFDPAVTGAQLADVTPHDLRASHASWVADAYGVMTAAKRLGHANGSVTTRHYARPVPGRDAEVAEGLNAWLAEGHEPTDGARKGHDQAPGASNSASSPR